MAQRVVRSKERVRLVPREKYPPGKESSLYQHLELGSASVESLISFTQRTNNETNRDKDDNDVANPTDLLNNNTDIVLHPVFVQLGMDYATGKIIGSYRRCHAFLESLSIYLGDMKPIEGDLLSARLINYINSVVQYLSDCRAVPLPFDNIISKCQDIIDQASRLYDSQEQCIREIRERVDEYILELQFQQDETVSNGQKHISNGDVVLTFGHSECVLNTLLEAQRRGCVVKVIVLDSRPLLEGKKMVHNLTLNRFECEYTLVTSLQYIMPQVSKVLLGAHAVLSNGSLLARSGSALTALAAKRSNKPVLVCCEAFKFVRQAYLDSICHNELGLPQNILLSTTQQSQAQEHVFNSPLSPSSTQIEDGSGGNGSGNDNSNITSNSNKNPLLHQTTAGAQNEKALSNWLSVPNLKLLNLRFDLTPPNYINAIITNYDTIPPSSASVVVREQLKRSNNQSSNNNNNNNNNTARNTTVIGK
jgi:translation initiation factor eIF-2B subunit delta